MATSPLRMLKSTIPTTLQPRYFVCIRQVCYRFGVMSAILMHVYDAAPPSQHFDQIAPSVVCLNRNDGALHPEALIFGRP